MRNILAPLLVVILSISSWADTTDPENIFSGEWVVVPASSPASFVFEFKDNGRVINKTTKTVGTYELLKNSRILIEFTGELIIMEYYESDGSILLNGQLGVQPQLLSLTFVEPTEENRKEVQETYETRFKAQQDAVMRIQKQSIEVAVRNNLRQITSAAQMYMLENGVTEVSYEMLLEENILEPIEPINGESYEDLVVDMDSTELTVLDADATVHSYTY
jgi:hypothetical protein